MKNNAKVIKLLCLYLLVIIIPLLISIAFCYSIELPNGTPKVEHKSIFEIFLHNILIALLLIVLTDVIAIPVLMINSFYLGIILGSIIKSTSLEYICLSTVHIPFELIGWTLVIFISRQFRINFHRLIKIEKIAVKSIFKKIFYFLIPIYILAAVIEGLEIYFILKG
ncbi:hypothetical protein HMPREF2580_04060 [Staphylococcus sp. HMSC036D05]|uniref:stage II sporulation protein M n=1 Tax=Staphylococcus sp. HMSC036D05 TaxID=1715059 RepID=UPI0008A91D80|nr:stage II sporulation protein M [Staphylococcus sp. HMSC036D05]OHO72667.1 hypothetical protein HMPREF2580_04060 [Staphylococcus sp. HMSC036D05]